MLVINKGQVAALEEAALRQFEDDMVRHLRQFAPLHAKGVGEPGLRQVIRQGTTQAKGYGFTLKGPVQLFLELMVSCGSQFDTDPLLPWCRPHLLPGPERGDQMALANMLHADALQYRKKVVGDNFEVEAAAIRRLLGTPLETWLSGDLTDDGLEASIRTVYPERLAEAEPAAVRHIIGQARRTAKQHELAASSGGAVVCALMVAFGHGCLSDPQFPWMAESLRNNARQPSETRAERLAVRALAYLSDGLAEMEKG